MDREWGGEDPFLDDAGNISQKGKISHVTSREKDVIEFICQGLSNRRSPRLALSEHTVKAHLNAIFRKLNVTNRSKLVALATHGPTELSV